MVGFQLSVLSSQFAVRSSQFEHWHRGCLRSSSLVPVSRHRQFDHEPGAAWLAIYSCDVPSGRFHDGANDGESQAAMTSGWTRMGGEARLEHAVDDFGRDSGTGILHTQDQ